MSLHIRPESLLRVPPTFKRLLSTAGPAESEAFAAWVRSQGYDGVVTQYGDAYEIAMLDPTKVRSTQAAFDPDGENSSDLLFSASGGQAPPSAPQADAIRKRLSEYPELSNVEVVQSASELPESVLWGMLKQGVRPNDVGGIYNPETGSPMIVADNLVDEADAVRVGVHEAVGHYGIRGVLGKDLEPVLEQVFRSYARSEAGRHNIAEIKEAYPHIAHKAHTREGRLELAEELIAHTIESDARPKLRERVMSAIRRQLRKLFPGIEWRTSDILALGEQSRRWLRRQQAQRAADQVAPTITRYSQRRGDNKPQDFIDRQLGEGRVRYLQTKKGPEWLQSVQLQLPEEGVAQGPDTKILTPDDIGNQDNRYSLIQQQVVLSPEDMAARLREEFPGLKLDLMGRGQRVTVSRVVAPERGQGIGSAVMQRLTDWPMLRAAPWP